MAVATVAPPGVLPGLPVQPGQAPPSTRESWPAGGQLQGEQGEQGGQVQAVPAGLSYLEQGGGLLGHTTALVSENIISY